MISRGKLLALVAPGALVFNPAATPWAVEGSTESFVPRLSATVPGCSSARVDRLVQAPPAPDHFSTKARSIT
ncbi:MAG TPA: hypothetical protein VFY24_00650 [Azospira sp.]|nr:hypothetical protein [Azospira sp.]